MKLLQKTNRAYLTLSASIFLIAGAAIYLAMNFILEAQISEKMDNSKAQIIRHIGENMIVSINPPYLEVKELQQNIGLSDKSIDTLIFDPDEAEKIPFRQMTSNAIINGRSYQIIIRNTLVEKSDILLAVILVIASVFILLLISLYLINKRLSIILWKPFYTTLDDLKKFSHEKSGFSITAQSDIDEFAELNSALQKLTKKIIDDYLTLKRFTEDASHEIQTPLAIIQSKLETLLQYPDLKKEQVEILNSAYNSTLRISKLTQTLLLLTKIANNQFPEKRTVNLSELLEEKIQLFEDHVYGKELTLNKVIEKDCFLETNFFLTESLIINLFGNALKYCSPKGIVSIFLNKDQFIISNSGVALDVPSSKLFERFYKNNESSDSHGLGLSIVNDICSMYKWDIKYDYENGQHKFIIKF